MTKHRRSKNEIITAILVCCIPIVAFIAYCIFWVVTSPSNLAEYRVKSTKCEQREELQACTMLLAIKNNSDRRFAPDFTGTQGPGFAETGVWGAYVVTTSGEKVKAYVDETTYDFIDPNATVQTSATFDIKPGDSPRVMILFDEKIQL